MPGTMGANGPLSGFRRRQPRVCTSATVVLVRADGSKCPGRVLNVGVGGMQVQCDTTPAYGEAVTLIAQLDGTEEWLVLPGRVRWLLRNGFGVTFDALSVSQQRAVDRFVAHSAA